MQIGADQLLAYLRMDHQRLADDAANQKIDNRRSLSTAE
jgi:hypothetical protein